VELLTVVAIVGVLATLLLTALTSAQKASRQARCISNLHQLSLALNMYLDDYEKRSADLAPLTASRYLASRDVLLCPADKTGNWGGLVNPQPVGVPATTSFAGAKSSDDPRAAPEPIRHSYLHPLPWEDWAWDRLAKLGSSAGIAACQLHGLGRPNPDAPSVYDFQGLILRAQRDGAVVKRKVFWDTAASRFSSRTGTTDMSIPTSLTDAAGAGATTLYPWQLFTDEPQP
jgi:type II secretory pathway pseudopilin PulG